MARMTPEERRIQKEQARAQREAQRAAAAAKRAARRRRTTDVVAGDAIAEAAALPRLELVTDPGRVKRLHWDADAHAPTPPEEAASSAPLHASEGPLQSEGTPPSSPETPQQEPRLVGRRRTLYTTDHGNRVVAYEQGGRRQLALTEARGGRLEEVPFDEAQVDRVIGQAEPAPAREAQPEPPGREKARRFFFLRRKPSAKQEAAEAPVAEHVYRPVDPVQAPPRDGPITSPESTVEAWEPHAALAQAPAQPPARRARVRAARRSAPRKPQLAYGGDNHPVIDLEGIGPVHAKKLERMGIPTTGLLGVARPGRIARRLGVPAKTVRTWQAEAELLKVRGIGPQFAEALARAGVSGIDELKRRSAQDIARQVADYLGGLDVTVVGQPVTPRRVAAWMRRAKPMRRVKVDRRSLATANHGIPPPWLREGAQQTGRKGARKPAAAKRPKRRPT